MNKRTPEHVVETMRSPIYRHPLLYHYAMRFLYGRNFEERYKAIAELIPENSEVCELCMGDAYLFLHYLAKKNTRYTGLDINEGFVKRALDKNVNARVHDVLLEPIPPADYIVMQASLYQFIPNHREILTKIISSAKKTAIISEPVINLSTSANPVIAFIAGLSANPGKGYSKERFNNETLLSLFREFPGFNKSVEIKGGREMIGVFEKG